MNKIRIRREPPTFRVVQVAQVEQRSERMVRVTLAGQALNGMKPWLPAASLRLLLPLDGGDLVLPTWVGNNFILDGGIRPIIRTLTPLEIPNDPVALNIEIVRHGRGLLSEWVDRVEPGEEVAFSGMGRGYDIGANGCASPPEDIFLLLGDESALPAIATILNALPPETVVAVHVEVFDSSARIELPDHPGATVRWCERELGSRPGDSLLGAVATASITANTHIWAAGEAASMQRIRRHLFEERGISRSQAVVRGYWKQR